MSRITITSLIFAAVAVAPAAAQEADPTVGGSQGADLSLEAIEPENEPVSVGLAGQEPADIARFLLANGAGGAQLSPDGQSIAFSRSLTGAPQLWTVPVAGGQPRQLTFGNGINLFRWSPDGSGLLYGADNDGNERQAYYFIAADGGGEQVVLPAEAGAFRVFGDFAADGQSFVYASTVRNGLDFDIYRSTIAGETQLIHEGRFGNTAQSLSPDGRFAIITETVGEDGDNLFLLDVTDGSMRTISAPESRASHSLGGFAWLNDSSGFYFSTNLGREFGALTRFDLASGDMTTIRSVDHDIENVSVCGADDSVLAWTVNNDGFDALHIYNRTSGANMATPEFPAGVLALDCAGERMMIRVSDYRTPGDLYVWDFTTGTLSQSFASNLAGLNADSLVQPQSVRFPARDGVMLQGLLYLPREAAQAGDGPPPVMFIVHGGPTAQAQGSFRPIAQYHVGRGVAVFETNVRGSTGFGRSYVALDDRENRLDSVRDLVDLLDALGSAGMVDADRAAVVGGSYGGYMVNAVLAAYPDAFAAGVSLFGVADWVTALEVASPALKASDRIEYGDISEQRWRDFYTVNSPIRQADRIRVPVLFSHGVMDPRIDISETETMVRTLRGNGIEAPFIRIPDEGHGWRKLSNRLFYYRRQAEFIEAQLMDEASE